jgi:hypothetical protein
MMMSEKARQQLEDHLRRLEQQRQETRRRLRALARHTQHELRYRCGELVELAGLASLDPATLLGGLCALAERLTDTETVAHWKTVGEGQLANHNRRKARQKRPVLPAMDGLSPRIVSKEHDSLQE